MTVVAAAPTQRACGAAILVAVLCYLVPFVPRGWMPHDEGMLGQSADRVLHGDIPHVDYEEPYTGGLAWLYAGVFGIAGVDLLKLRWLLFAGAAAAAGLTYAILRRFLTPAASGFATGVALVWRFSNYFAAPPSGGLPTAALVCLWALIRYIETARWRHLIIAALAAGFAIAIKQTGIYLFIALIWSLLFDAADADRSAATWRRVAPLLRWGAALAV